MRTKKTMKKIIPVFLVTAMLAASVTACGNKDGSMTSGSNMTQGSKTVTAPGL